MEVILWLSQNFLNLIEKKNVMLERTPLLRAVKKKTISCL